MMIIISARRVLNCKHALLSFTLLAITWCLLIILLELSGIWILKRHWLCWYEEKQVPNDWCCFIFLLKNLNTWSLQAKVPKWKSLKLYSKSNPLEATPILYSIMQPGKSYNTVSFDNLKKNLVENEEMVWKLLFYLAHKSEFATALVISKTVELLLLVADVDGDAGLQPVTQTGLADAPLGCGRHHVLGAAPSVLAGTHVVAGGRPQRSVLLFVLICVTKYTNCNNKKSCSDNFIQFVME